MWWWGTCNVLSSSNKVPPQIRLANVSITVRNTLSLCYYFPYYSDHLLDHIKIHLFFILIIVSFFWQTHYPFGEFQYSQNSIRIWFMICATQTVALIGLKHMIASRYTWQTSEEDTWTLWESWMTASSRIYI